MDEEMLEKKRHPGLRFGLSVFYSAAGILHLAWPEPFLTITPGWVPYPETVIALTGICELLGAIGLWLPATVRAAGLGLALYAICVYPANVKHAMDGLGAADAGLLAWAYHVPRLALQPVLIWLPLYATGILRWPFRQATKQ